jgi:hypothetical protein
MRYRHEILIVLAAISVAAVIAMASSRIQNPGGSGNTQRVVQKHDPNEWPVAEFEAPEPADVTEREKRQRRNKLHNRSHLGVIGAINSPPGGDVVSLITEWQFELTALPVSQSDLVVIGEVADARAFVSEDKLGVYSEFTVKLEDVLKKETALGVTKGDILTVLRMGGRVRAPSGRVVLFNIGAQRMPLKGGRYVLFLKAMNKEQDFCILTAYELRAGKAYPLDYSDLFDAYDGVDEATLLQAVRESIARP